MSGGGVGRGSGRERIPSRLHTVSTEPEVGLEFTKPRDRDLCRYKESDSFCVLIFCCCCLFIFEAERDRA